MNTYKSILTDAGLAAEAASHASGTPIKITHFAVGDGNGAAYTVSSSQTGLKRETYRAPVNAIRVDTNNANYLIVECVVPAAVGGWYVREAAVILDTGTVWGIANYPDTYKPALSDGAGKDLYLRLIFEVSNAGNVTLSIDPSVVLASRQYVDDAAQAAITQHEASGTHADASETTKGFVRLATSTEALAGTSKFLAVHPAGLKAAVDALVGGAPGALDTLNELATSLGNDANFATSVANALALKAPLDSPAFIGTPTAETAPVGTATNQIATTAFVASGLLDYDSKRDTAVWIDEASPDPYVISFDAWGKTSIYINKSNATVVLPDIAFGKSINIYNVSSSFAKIKSPNELNNIDGFVDYTFIPPQSNRQYICKTGSYVSLTKNFFDVPFIAGWGATMTGEDLTCRQYGAVILPRPIVFDPARFFATATVSPTGAAVCMDIKLNGTSVFSELPMVKDRKINSSNGLGTSTAVCAGIGSLLTFHITQVGSIIKGQKICAVLRGWC